MDYILPGTTRYWRSLIVYSQGHLDLPDSEQVLRAVRCYAGPKTPRLRPDSIKNAIAKKGCILPGDSNWGVLAVDLISNILAKLVCFIQRVLPHESTKRTGDYSA
jgi:hypothetical protein